MLRHTALFMWRDTTDDTQKLVAKKGLAYLGYGCPSVRAVDFGSDLLGGSGPLLDVKPWERTPLWHARSSGPPASFDMALHLDFDDQTGLDAYNVDDVHHEVGVYNASVCRGERTARVDWWYDGPSRVEKGGVRHTSLYLWNDEAMDPQKRDVRDAFLALERSIPTIRSVAVGDNVGTLTTDYDLIVDEQFADLTDLELALDHAAYKDALAVVAAATKYEWTARIAHAMSSG